MTEPKHFERPEKRSSVLEKNKANYRETCRAAGNGFNSSTMWRSEAHHILCEHSIAQRKDDYPEDAATGEYIEDCLWITEWDINNKDNLIGLPRNRQFKECYGKESESSWEPVNLPSHHVDHLGLNGYTEEVRVYLKDNLWSTLSAAKKQHKVDAEVIKQQLEDGSTCFGEFLADRGKRENGTKMCWKLQRDKAYERRWYHPFSMGKEPSHRRAAVSKTNMTGIFEKLG